MNSKWRESVIPLFLGLGLGLVVLLAAVQLGWLPQLGIVNLGRWALYAGFVLFLALRRIPWYWAGLLGAGWAGGVLGVTEALAGTLDAPSGILAGLVVLVCVVGAWRWPRRVT